MRRQQLRDKEVEVEVVEAKEQWLEEVEAKELRLEEVVSVCSWQRKHTKSSVRGGNFSFLSPANRISIKN